MASVNHRRRAAALPPSCRRTPASIQQKVMKAGRSIRSPPKPFSAARLTAATWLKGSSPFSQDARLEWNWLNHEKNMPPSSLQQYSGYDFTWPMSSHPAALYADFNPEEHLHDNSANLYQPPVYHGDAYLDQNMHRLLEPHNLVGAAIQVPCNTQQAPQAVTNDNYDFNTALPTYGPTSCAQKDPAPQLHAEPLSCANMPTVSNMNFDAFSTSVAGGSTYTTDTFEQNLRNIFDTDVFKLRASTNSSGHQNGSLPAEGNIRDTEKQVDIEMMGCTLPPMSLYNFLETSGSTTESLTTCTPELISSESSITMSRVNTQRSSNADNTIGLNKAFDPLSDLDLLLQPQDFQGDTHAFFDSDDDFLSAHAGNSVAPSTVWSSKTGKEASLRVTPRTIPQDELAGANYRVLPQSPPVQQLTSADTELRAADRTNVSRPVTHDEIDWDAYSNYDPGNPFGTDWDRDLGAEPYLFATDELGFPIEPTD